MLRIIYLSAKISHLNISFIFICLLLFLALRPHVGHCHFNNTDGIEIFYTALPTEHSIINTKFIHFLKWKWPEIYIILLLYISGQGTGINYPKWDSRIFFSLVYHKYTFIVVFSKWIKGNIDLRNFEVCNCQKSSPNAVLYVLPFVILFSIPILDQIFLYF